jgi:hypothetical protein
MPKLYAITLLSIISFAGYSQSALKQFFKLPRPEKCWVITHPFKAKKAYRISLEARHKADSLCKTNTLDADANGGQVDAFRHSYWIAILSCTFNKKAALKLGKAHEKGNFIYYKKHKTEDGTIPDKISSDMDLFNNNIGAKIADSLKICNHKLIEKTIIDAIKQGKMKIILKDKNKNFLDCKKNIIPQDSLKGKWINNKCLVPSNYTHK